MVYPVGDQMHTVLAEDPSSIPSTHVGWFTPTWKAQDSQRDPFEGQGQMPLPQSQPEPGSEAVQETLTILSCERIQSSQRQEDRTGWGPCPRIPASL